MTAISALSFVWVDFELCTAVWPHQLRVTRGTHGLL